MEQENRNQQNAAPQVSIGDQIKVRREKLAQLQAEGMDPFAITRFVSTTTAQEIKEHFDEMEGKPVSIAGRLMSKRGMGKVSFCDLQDKTGRIQLYARKDEMDEAEYNRFKKYDIGDIVGVEGEIFRTQRGEMSVRAKTITLLSKSLLPLPEKWHGLKDQDTRYRKRYLDLIVNPEVKNTFVTRSKILREIRNYLDGIGYVEVETPVLLPLQIAAAARITANTFFFIIILLFFKNTAGFCQPRFRFYKFPCLLCLDLRPQLRIFLLDLRFLITEDLTVWIFEIRNVRRNTFVVSLDHSFVNTLYRRSITYFFRIGKSRFFI